MIQLLLVLHLCNPTLIQPIADSIPKKLLNFYTTITTDSALKKEGYLYAIDDSTISLTAAQLSNRRLPLPNVNVQQYGYATINQVEMKRVNRIGRGALFGGLIGLGAGILGGFASGSDDPNSWIAFSAGEKAVGLGLVLGTAGALIGLLVGAFARKQFTIGGRKDKFQEMKADLLHQANATPAQ